MSKDDLIDVQGTVVAVHSGGLYRVQCDQGHEVHVAYQTSGNIAVWDEAAMRHVDFVREFGHDVILRPVAMQQSGETRADEGAAPALSLSRRA